MLYHYTHDKTFRILLVRGSAIGNNNIYIYIYIYILYIGMSYN